MKNKQQISTELADLVQSHYYSEDFELISSVQAYQATLSGDEAALLTDVVYRRLLDEGSIVDILLCGVARVPSAVPVLAEKLNRADISNQMTRALIVALQTYASDEAYTAVERFLDSDQEMETLQALARIDFVRTLPYTVRLMRKEHYHPIVLHMFYDRMKKVGLNALIADLKQSSTTQSDAFRESLLKTIHSKPNDYNPFSEEEIQALVKNLGA
jgi:hypothetical protein